jgi:hypothetical protein
MQVFAGIAAAVPPPTCVPAAAPTPPETDVRSVTSQLVAVAAAVVSTPMSVPYALKTPVATCVACAFVIPDVVSIRKWKIFANGWPVMLPLIAQRTTPGAGGSVVIVPPRCDTYKCVTPVSVKLLTRC